MTPRGAVALAWGAPADRGAEATGADAFVLDVSLVVAEADGAGRWTLGDGAEGVAFRANGGVSGWRIVADDLDLRLTFGLPPDGNVAIFRLDVTHTGAAPRALVLASDVRLAAGAWEDVAELGARTARLGDGRYAAHTFVPDDGAMPGVETPQWGVSTPGTGMGLGGAAGLVRTATLAPGETAGWTVGIGVGATARKALGAVFPHLSGARSRAALAAAKQHVPDW